ncbi:MAG: hypothetical protein E7324_00890 [Clostridiales bacterium]|nr:hypothetical protein [Clostridiales bacterium]
MTKREIMWKTIAGEKVDQVPYSFDLTNVIAEKLIDHYQIADGNVKRGIGDYLCTVWIDSGLRNLDEKHMIDDFGTVWIKSDEWKHMGDWGGIASVPLKEPTMEGYVFPQPTAERYKAAVESAKHARERGEYVCLFLDGLLDVAWHLRGFEQLMEDFICEEEFVEELMDASLEFILKEIAAAPDCVDGIRFGEDWGQQKGLFMGKRLWDKFLKPRLGKMYAAAKARGFQVLIHSCGDIHEVFDDVIEMGVQAINPIQPETMDVKELKEKYGHRVTFWGGLGCQSTIPLGTKEDVEKECKERLALLGKGGRYIFGPAGAIPTEAPVENVVTLVEFAKHMND